MTTKEYLSQAYRIDQRINSKLAQVMTLRDLLEKTTVILSGTPKLATRNPHTMEDTIAKVVDLENEINMEIDAPRQSQSGHHTADQACGEHGVPDDTGTAVSVLQTVGRDCGRYGIQSA